MKAATSPVSIANTAARCLAGMLCALMAVLPVAAQTQDDSVTNSGHLSARSPKSNNAKTTKKKRTGTSHSAAGRSKTASRAARAARTARLRQAFVASTDLRPMAQQLANMRTPEAYAGVTAYARKHTGEAALAAYLALGHAYLLDKRYTEAEESLRLAGKEAEELADYVDYLGAEASHEAGDDAAAEGLLRGFAGRYPDSIFDDDAPVLEVNVLLGMNNATGAQRVLEAARAQGVEGRSDFELAGGQVEFALGQTRGGSADIQAALVDSSTEPGFADCASAADGDGIGGVADAGRVAEPGRCLLQRRAVRRGGRTIPRAAADTGTEAKANETSWRWMWLRAT